MDWDHTERLPFVESCPLDVGLEALVLDDELHLLEEGGREGGGLLAEEDVEGLRDGVAELTLGAHGALAALGVLAVGEAVCCGREEQNGF